MRAYVTFLIVLFAAVLFASLLHQPQHNYKKQVELVHAITLRNHAGRSFLFQEKTAVKVAFIGYMTAKLAEALVPGADVEVLDVLDLDELNAALTTGAQAECVLFQTTESNVYVDKGPADEVCSGIEVSVNLPLDKLTKDVKQARKMHQTNATKIVQEILPDVEFDMRFTKGLAHVVYKSQNITSTTYVPEEVVFYG